jgi:hypothetical protein
MVPQSLLNKLRAVHADKRLEELFPPGFIEWFGKGDFEDKHQAHMSELVDGLDRPLMSRVLTVGKLLHEIMTIGTKQKLGYTLSLGDYLHDPEEYPELGLITGDHAFSKAKKALDYINVSRGSRSHHREDMKSHHRENLDQMAAMAQGDLVEIILHGTTLIANCFGHPQLVGAIRYLLTPTDTPSS